MRLISKPVLCNYYLTYRCNAKCHFCDIWERPSPLANPESVLSNLIHLKQLGVKVIDFTGGEPLLHPDLDYFLKEARNLGFITTLTTNTLLYHKWAERIQGLVDMLHFSLDYDNAEQHNRARGVPCYDSVIESIDLAKRLGEKPDILFTVFEDNYSQIETVYQNITLPNQLMLLLNPAFSYHNINSGEVLTPDMIKGLKRWGSKEKVYINRAFLELHLDGGNHINNPVCRAASSTVVISPDNQLVLPCYHLGIKEFPIDGNLYELYHSDLVKSLIIREGTWPECEGCTINCYMQPSFAVNINKYFWYALPSTIKYNYIKGTWKQLV